MCLSARRLARVRVRVRVRVGARVRVRVRLGAGVRGTGSAPLGQLDDARHEGVLRRAVDVHGALEHRGDGEDGGGRDLGLIVLDGLVRVRVRVGLRVRVGVRVRVRVG